jgi:hypothetical protein
MVLGILSSLSVGLLMILVRNLWGYAYSNEKEVVEYISRIMPILAVTFLFDDMQCILSGKYKYFSERKFGTHNAPVCILEFCLGYRVKQYLSYLANTKILNGIGGYSIFFQVLLGAVAFKRLVLMSILVRTTLSASLRLYVLPLCTTLVEWYLFSYP